MSTLWWGVISGPDTTLLYLNEVTPAVAEIRSKCIWYPMVKNLKIALLSLKECMFHVSMLIETFLWSYTTNTFDPN